MAEEDLVCVRVRVVNRRPKPTYHKPNHVCEWVVDEVEAREVALRGAMTSFEGCHDYYKWDDSQTSAGVPVVSHMCSTTAAAPRRWSVRVLR